MDSWIFQGGYPVVEAELVGPRTLRLRQERFRFDGVVDDTRWQVPVRFTAAAKGGDRVGQRVLLTEREQDVELPADTEWVHLDSGGSGFYRSRYVGALRTAVAGHVGELSPIERYNLVDHEFAFTVAGQRTAAEFCEFARSFGDDTELAVWQRLAAAFGALDRIVDDDARPRFEATVRGLAAPALHRMGWTPAADEPSVDGQRRATLFELLGTIGADDEVRARARTLHDAYLEDAETVAPELVAAAITVIADSGGADEFHAFVDRWRAPIDPQEQMRYLYALGRFHDDACFQEMLDLSISEVRTQNAPFLLARALGNRTHGPAAWKYVRQNWSTILEKFPASTIVRMVEGVRWLIPVAADVQGFFAEHPVEQAPRTMEQHLERLRVNVAFHDRDHEAFSRSLA
jgi:puromycin-sensitive aminopeptidase